MGLFDQLQSGTRLYDNRTGCERLVDKIETRGQVVFLSFRNPQNGAVERQPFSAAEVESRFEIVQPGRTLFRAQTPISLSEKIS